MARRSISGAQSRLLASEPPAGGSESLQLIRLLERLGDQASRFVCLEDARWHIVSCQAHHVAATIAATVGWPTSGVDWPTAGTGIGELVRDIRGVVVRMPEGVLDAWCASEGERLLLLALAVNQ
ncbi:hypothetical protein [Arthrobacter sp. NEB 688]|uniref:hypothetical protein n=1 Tax=Arthrobacter sp. NEB 688 TaxID=904039 RepID=UPI001566D46D|nr:hypothetical protein [Arthrobacter sp. NEB 688]QKE85105.1 hypothetical protein HL663_14960 [Arthrobacter sp. NEB 688]